MSSRAANEAPKADAAAPPAYAPYRLRNIPLSSEGGRKQFLGYITCAEFWDSNLYIGTSTGEILHYFLIPADTNAGDQHETFIFASQRVIASQETPTGSKERPGVQQILVLPTAAKVCILCNGTLTFYTLPELTPAFESTKPITCAWIGGVDQNDEDTTEQADGSVIMICQKSHIRLVKITERPQVVRNIEFGGCTMTARRGNIACAANNDSYYLLDFVEPRGMFLSGIRSISEEVQTSSDQESESAKGPELANAVPRSSPADRVAEIRASPDRGHGRSSSLNHLRSDSESTSVEPAHRRRASQADIHPTLFPPRNSSLSPVPPLPERSKPTEPQKQQIDPSQGGSISASPSPSKSPPPPPAQVPDKQISTDNKSAPVLLKPNVASPTPDEFFVTTGTSYQDPGLGMFVTLDGEASGTIEFTRYPECIAFDGLAPSSSIATESDSQTESFILALVRHAAEDTFPTRVEIQRWDSDRSDPRRAKSWLDIPLVQESSDAAMGQSFHTTLRKTITSCDMPIPEVEWKLALDRVDLANGSGVVQAQPGDEERRRSELTVVRQMNTTNVSTLLSAQDQLWWLLRNPEFLQLDSRLDVAAEHVPPGHFVDRTLVEWVWNELRGQDPQPGIQYVGIGYVRQKASLLLFMDLVYLWQSGSETTERDRRVTEEALMLSEIDPRVVLTVLPALSNDCIEGNAGVWLPGGVKELVETFLRTVGRRKGPESKQPSDEGILQLVKRYLQLWRQKKGFGSISNERELFESIDGALIHTLLLLDCSNPPGPAIKGSVRSELYAVVDSGVDCFEHAVDLLEGFQRLYVLSRLYHGQNMTAQVLAVMRRIISGEEDTGGEFADGEKKLRKYLSEIDNSDLVREYGTWLASRNPRLGVQVFADRNAKVRFEPREAVEILKQKAPRAVKEYLEHLVFDKNLAQHANDLINYYLDSVLAELEASNSARKALLESYRAYRALRPPKPNYTQFATDNAVDADWWRNRLRLLQLLGGSHGPASQYDLPWILARVETYKQELVPEMIILNGRQGQHKEALALLTHGLGDFDTAISYCVLGGASTYSQLYGYLPEESIPSRDEQTILFRYLLEEFIRIEDQRDRVTQTGELLERFAGWFDVAQVLARIPDSWSVELLSKFLESALRQLVSERNETAVTKALTGVVNINTSFELVEKMESRSFEALT